MKTKKISFRLDDKYLEIIDEIILKYKLLYDKKLTFSDVVRMSILSSHEELSKPNNETIIKEIATMKLKNYTKQYLEIYDEMYKKLEKIVYDTNILNGIIKHEKNQKPKKNNENLDENKFYFT